MVRSIALVFLLPVLCAHAAGKTLQTNEVTFTNAPAWLTASRLNRVVERMQSKLDWDIRKISVAYYEDQNEFEKLHGFGETVLAITTADAQVHIGPRTTQEKFDATLAHELVHVILRQKYKNAIPRWLEEGLAGYLPKSAKVDYAWLAKQPARDVYSLSHPFKGLSGSAGYHYQASQALMELLSAKCGGAEDLIQMSVGKKLENYLPTMCGIQDLNAEFKKWLARKATRG